MTSKPKAITAEHFSHNKPFWKGWLQAPHDGNVHNPLGAAAYVYEKELLQPLLTYLGAIPAAPLETSKPLANGVAEARPTLYPVDSGVLLPQSAGTSTTTIILHIGAQPNNSPHAGTIVTFALAFILARDLQNECRKLRWTDDISVVVQLDLVDTAPDNSKSEIHDGIYYQCSQRATGKMNEYLQDYRTLLAELSAFVDDEVKYTITTQETLMRMPGTRNALRAIVADANRIASELAPERKALAIRSACPVNGCATADKHGVKNEYEVGNEGTIIRFHCPTHGVHSVCLENPEEIARLELNTPLRNLTRTLVYLEDTGISVDPSTGVPARVHMRVTGADYAGMYQEQLLFRQFIRLRDEIQHIREEDVPVIFYAPLITDWSGAKLSKSLYVKDGAYKYLDAHGMDYLLSFELMTKYGKDRRVLYRLVESWVREPKKLFRNYSIYYLHDAFMEAELEKSWVRRMYMHMSAPIKCIVACIAGYALLKYLSKAV